MRETTNYGLKITEGNDNWKNIFDDNADNMETIDEALAAKLENVPDMGGATALTPGTAGLAPAPSAGETNRFLRADGTWTVPAGSGDSEVGIYTIDATIPVSAWQGSGPYTVTISNSSIISTMQVLEWSIVNETEATPLMLGPTEPTVSAGSLTISTTVKPVASWTVHFDLGTDGSNVLAEVAGKAGQELLGYKEEGNTASRTIASGKFVVWKGNLYKAKVAIPQGTAFSTSNLTAVGDGGFNELQTKIGDVGSTDLQSQVTSLNSNTTAVTRHTRKTSFSLSDLQAAVADQDLAKHGLKVGDETTINGHTYVIAGLNVMKGTHDYTCTSNHVGLIVIPHTTHVWNASGKTNEGADGRGAGYSNCDLQYYLENDVVAMCNTDLGSAHLYAHRKMMGNAINETGYNRFGTATGCTSGWAWKENCYISALTEAQVHGGDHWSSSGYDTGEANTLLPVFSEYKHTEIFKNEYPWLRNVSSASQACLAAHFGLATGVGSVSDGCHVAGLILYH